MKNKQATYFSWLLKTPLYLWTLVFVCATLLYIIGISFFERGEVIGVGDTLTISNYQRWLEPQYAKVFLESLKLASITTLLCIGFGYPFGYFLARLSPTAKTIVLMLVIVPFWTNALIRMYGWRILLLANGPINQLLLDLSIIQKPLKLLYTDMSVLLGMVYALLPFMILPVYTTVEKLDVSIVNASRDLGASPFYAFCSVTVPLTLPGLMAGCVLVFIPSMGLFFISDLLGGSKSVLAGGLIRNMINNRDLPLAAALSVILLCMTTVIIFFYRKWGGKDEVISL